MRLKFLEFRGFIVLRSFKLQQMCPLIITSYARKKKLKGCFGLFNKICNVVKVKVTV